MACLNFPLFTSEIRDENDMVQETLVTKVGKLEERVHNHITFFKWAFAGAFAWLAWITLLLFQTKSAVTNVAKTEANTPAQIVASLLNSPTATQSEAQANLAAAASVLQSSKIGKVKPDSTKLKAISDKLLDDQRQYPELPQVWQTTGVFINYKFQALLPSATAINEESAGKPCNEKFQVPGSIRFENCEINLEKVAADIHNVTSNGQHIPIRFANCVVHYSGGALPDAPMEFENSILTFHVEVVPPRNAINAMRQLAQANTLDHINIQG
jgi:hypothetical protein